MKIRKPTPAGAVFVGVVVVLSLALVPAAFAGKGNGNKPSGGGSSTITGPVMVVDNNADGLPNWGDTVTFNVSTTATTTPFVNLVCYQNGVEVASGWKGFWDGSIDPNWNFGLSSPTWQSGAANCVASLDKQTKQGWQQLASVSFQVGA
jgi:hypothetical protein